MKSRRRARHPAPRWAQGVLLVGFLLLFGRTAYRGEDLIDWPVHVVFRLDPLAALAEGVAAGVEIFDWTWLGAGLLLVATALLGRFFCGWACPLGTLLDLARGGLRRLLPGPAGPRRLPPWTATALLAALASAAVLSLPLLGLFDPLSLLLRSLTLALHPQWDEALRGGFRFLARADLAPLDAAADFLRPRLLSFRRPAFLLSGATGVLFLTVLLLELRAPRFWCTHLCPLGALLGLAARLSPMRRRRSAECGACEACEAACPTGAALGDPADPSLCLQCGACAARCPRGARQPGLEAARSAAQLPRRTLLASAGLGAVAALAAQVRAEERVPPPQLLRPPGARPEEEFRLRCIRCGACMRVCPRGALHPTLWEAGLGGAWSPRLVPRLGYCEYHCRLCGQVCPTGAIAYLEEGQKEKTVIGLAHFVEDRCIPYRRAEGCMVCEEHCPTNPKAIVFREEVRRDPLGAERPVKVPRLVDERCIGCGICENKCPLADGSAILVTSRGESRAGLGEVGYG